MKLVAAVAILVALAANADAHDIRPGVLSLTEQSRGDYALHFAPPIDSRGDATEIAIDFPAGCTRNADRLHCDDAIAGTLVIRGMRGAAMKTLVILVRASGERSEWIVDAAAPQITIGASPPSGLFAWIRVGIMHILTGFDHLAFVIGLLLVLDFSLGRRLLVTITAFTLAHSLTLALAVLGVIAVHPAPVEACIALSVLLVAREGTHEQPTVIRRWPWLAAGAFGLIHGLGFATALRELGLPRESLARALVSFNVGVELGQLAVVAVLVALVAAARRLIDERRVVGRHVHRAACYLLGALAAWWLLDRVVELASGAR
ncbi:MAG TPA: HupE/UreJ family protein [Kofleriaceae bacterium]|nr:HupE/UreJ family protein [Kofleriaceae bacterium]